MQLLNTATPKRDNPNSFERVSRGSMSSRLSTTNGLRSLTLSMKESTRAAKSITEEHTPHLDGNPRAHDMIMA